MQEEAEIAAFEASNQEYIKRSLKLVRLMGMLWPSLETMLGLAIVLVLVARRPRSDLRAASQSAALSLSTPTWCSLPGRSSR